VAATSTDKVQLNSGHFKPRRDAGLFLCVRQCRKQDQRFNAEDQRTQRKTRNRLRADIEQETEQANQEKREAAN
jgi:hypothetical protein